MEADKVDERVSYSELQFVVCFYDRCGLASLVNLVSGGNGDPAEGYSVVVRCLVWLEVRWFYSHRFI